MHRDHNPLHFEIRNEQDELVEPPDGVTYSSSYEVLDTTAPDFDATGTHSCVFCASSDWRWVLHMKPNEPRAPLAWPMYLVSCDPCQQLRHTEQLYALRQRIMAGTGTGYLLEYLDELLDRIDLVKPRR